MAEIDFLNSGTQVIVTASEYKDVYNVLRDASGLHTQDIFMILLYIGTHTGHKMSANSYDGKQFRTSYLTKKQAGVLYGLAFRDGVIKNTEDFQDPRVINAAKTLFNEYANQGASLIQNKVLNDFDLNSMNKSQQTEMFISLVEYLLSESKAAPF
ncbi:hypothetical protein N654_1121 [Lactiplantibacillus plantarum 4_3]|jgi:hypothetical protein|uniref:hypothetical protein n=1 Tax=Lactiplantibacillus plantarum TaxID=1590 RepID=UPI0003D3BF03|nr:hypothetical protein [Lactiplantibacillus plantarum]ETF12425.1 hypothetical protein N654_1121 [Lactiplantibacillus plantarum 4_3]